MNYNDAAEKIIKNAIKSAVFIDENAKEPYSDETPSESETTLKLYNQFKEEGISLSIFKYSPEKYSSSISYLFESRDLVLLDWKLEGENAGGERSLELLAEIVNNQNHIPFCVIYTNETEDTVLNNILSYFSGSSKSEYEQYVGNLSDIEDEIKKANFLSSLKELSLNRFDNNKCKVILSKLYENNKELINRISSSKEEKLCSLIKCGIAYSNTIKSKEALSCPSSIDASSYTLCINNTIILILSKKEVQPKDLFEKFAKSVVDYNWGVMHLIGLELQNIQKRKDSIINPNILRVTKKALGYHKSKSEVEFDTFLKEVMLEQEALNIRNENLTLIDAIEEEQYYKELEKEYVSMNVFYNSSYIDKTDKTLSFGDVFKCGNEYYICITALCDCVNPEKIKNSFFFAKGQKIKPTKVLKSAETGFVSFLDEQTAVQWNPNNNDNDKIFHISNLFVSQFQTICCRIVKYKHFN